MKKAWSPEGEGSFRNHEAWIRLFYTGWEPFVPSQGSPVQDHESSGHLCPKGISTSLNSAFLVLPSPPPCLPVFWARGAPAVFTLCSHR